MGRKTNVRNGQLVLDNSKTTRVKHNVTHPTCRKLSSDVSPFEVSGISSTSKLVVRYRYEDFDEFKTNLQRYNKFSRRNIEYDDEGTSKEISGTVKSYYTCVGFANVRLQFCTSCNDEKKQEKSDMYFVDKYSIAQRRKVLCYGCLGSILREMKTN